MDLRAVGRVPGGPHGVVTARERRTEPLVAIRDSPPKTHYPWTGPHEYRLSAGAESRHAYQFTLPDGNDRTMNYFDDHALSWDKLLEALPDGTALLDKHGIMLHVNDLLVHLTGFSRRELVGEHVMMLVPIQHREKQASARREYARDPSARLIWSDQDLSVQCKDGSELPVDFAMSPLELDGESFTVASIRDNSVGREAELARAEAEERFRLAFEDNMAPMLLTDLDDRVIAANDALCQMLGRSREELYGFDSKHFTYPDDRGITEATHERIVHGQAEKVRYVKRYLHQDGRVIVAEVSKSPARDASGKTLYFVISERDITEERELTARLSAQALHDPLTGLANRALFEDRLALARARVVRQGGYGAVLLVDLDDFKGVNDTLGHLAGDQLLTAIARRLEVVTRSSDTLCRFGGDEFLYLAEGLKSPAESEIIAARLLGALAKPFSISGTSLEQRASIGVAIWDASNADEEDCVQNADVALYEVKRRNEGHYLVFAPSMLEQTVSRFTVVQELRHALQTDQIAMHYQPILDLSTHEVVGFEALMRWQHPERGSIPPSVFIPLAERSGLILDLGKFALRQAVCAAVNWTTAPGSLNAPYVTVNLSSRQFRDPDLLPSIEEALQLSGLGPERLVLEITEAVALFDVAETLGVLSLLRELGVGVALDNFGTGFSSLSYLALLQPRFIKIDQSFVRPSLDGLDSDRLLETIIALGDKLKMTMLAEGIETLDQLGRLRHLGGGLGQGFLFSPAVPASDVADLLERGPDTWSPEVAAATFRGASPVSESKED